MRLHAKRHAVVVPRDRFSKGFSQSARRRGLARALPSILIGIGAAAALKYIAESQLRRSRRQVEEVELSPDLSPIEHKPGPNGHRDTPFDHLNSFS